MDAAGPVATGTAALAAGIGVQIDIDARVGFIKALADGFHDKTGKVLHMSEQCFNGELNGGCGVVCRVATPSNARGRHSQARSIRKPRRVLPRKTHAGLFARPAAAVKRAGDINAGPAWSGRKKSEFYAACPLDGGEERAWNAAARPNIHTDSPEEPFNFICDLRNKPLFFFWFLRFFDFSVFCKTKCFLMFLC
ncbi:MAG: hypothetical protein H7A49_13280 [Akkermansiaceae bacterium]|nr:hypothetical protein [Akkermansiaceae bacterium]